MPKRPADEKSSAALKRNARHARPSQDVRADVVGSVESSRDDEAATHRFTGLMSNDMQHEDSVPRAAASRAYERLTDADLVALLPDIVDAIQPLAPSNEMFADGVRLARPRPALAPRHPRRHVPVRIRHGTRSLG